MFGIKDKNITIYIIDDDVLLLKILENKFRKTTNYNIFTFNTGEAFLHHYINNPTPKKHFEIAILDNNLSTKDASNKDGIEILKYIKEISQKLKVIILSGYVTPLMSDKMLRLGAEACIKKNENSFIRIQNNVNWLVSDYVIQKKQKQSRITFLLFFFVLIVIIILGFFSYIL